MRGQAGAQRAARKELQRLERQIDRLTVREKELTESLAAHASDYTRLVELGGQLREVQAEKARLEEDVAHGGRGSGLTGQGPAAARPARAEPSAQAASRGRGGAQEAGQGLAAGLGQGCEQGLLGFQQVGQGGVHPGLARPPSA